MSTSIEAQGHTVDEAIQIALNQLGVSRDKVEIDILHHPRRGVLGIGARRAKVRATIRESVMLDGEEFDMSGGSDLDDKPRRRRRRGGRSRGEGGAETGTEAPAAAAAPRPAAGREPGRPEGDRRGGGRRGDDGGRGRDDRRGGRGQGGEPRGDRQGGQAGAEGSSGRQGGQGGRGGQQRGGQQRDQRQPREGGQPREGSQQRDQQQPRDGQQARDQQQPREADGRRQGGRQGGREDGRPGGGREDGRPGGGREDGRQGGGREDGREDGRDRNSGRGRQGGRGAGRSEAGVEAGPGVEGAQPPASRPPAPRRQQPAVEEPPLDAETLELVRARADELVRELLEKMGFPAEVTSSVDIAAGEAVVSVRSESEGLLIGRRGQTLDSLEHIVNRMVLRGESYVEGRVLLDIGDYRKRRRESLDELAARLRGRAVDERRSVQVSPMSPRDRKYFGQAFAGDDSVEVRALGAGFYRRVIVAPAGMASSGMDVENVNADTDDLDQHDNTGRPRREPEPTPVEAEAAPMGVETAPIDVETAAPDTGNSTAEAES